jgi:O-antigen ligase
MVDNRGGLFMIIVAVSITQLFWHRRKIAVLVPLAIPFVYILIAVILLSTELSNLTDTLSRSKSDAQTLGGRGIIWIQVLDELSNFKPIHLVGYGMYGQQTSELSYGYLKIFSDYLTDTPERMSVHSGYLQTLIDFGYIGLILIMILNSVMMWRIASASNDGYPKIMLCVLVSMLLIGILEPVPTIYSRELFYIYFMLVVAGFGLTGDNSKLKTSVQI